MGSLSARDMVEHAPFDVALSWHLRSNHYPPIVGGEEFAKAAIAAIEDEDYDRMIQVGNYGPAKASEVFESWHLEFFVGQTVDAFFEGGDEDD